MTVFIASLFLPYTIDFKATELRSARRRSTPTSVTPPGDRLVGRLADARREGHTKSLSLTLTPGATTDDEKIFKSYASQSAGEIALADDPTGPGPNDPRLISWGRSRKFNQPRPKVALPPEPSILRGDSLQNETNGQHYIDAIPDRPDLSEEEQGSPRALLSDLDWVVKAAEQGNGGLRNAVHAAAQAGQLQDYLWVGTLGMPTDSLKDETRASIAEILEDQWGSLTVFVHDNEFLGHYTHFCRKILWPALHYQMQESPRHNEYDHYSWTQYRQVNEAFAKKIAAHWRPGDKIWIHDYHLLLLPGLLREKLPTAEIGFFLHAAFPSSEVVRCLTHRNALLNGLLGADLLAFQTDEYCNHFLHSCSRLLSLEVSVEGVQLKNRLVRVKRIPFGIDPQALEELRSATEVQHWITNICDRYQGKRLIVARDRLDGPGGIKQKLLAYEVFLRKYPQWRDKVVLIQVSSSTSELPELESQVSKIAMRINSMYSTLTHQPLVLLRQDISYSQFLALLSVAEIFMVTSLREGMNLTSHDFLNCQDGRLTSQRHGSLILSEFTGSAAIFSGHELLVNPWDYQQVADAIHKALEMSPEQKRHNWESLMEKKSSCTALNWNRSFTDNLSAAHQAQRSRVKPSQLSALSISALQSSYATSPRRLFFLEDTQTITSPNPMTARKAVAELKLLLQDPRNMIYVTSNKSPEQLEPYLKEFTSGDGVAAIGFIAENGCFLHDIPSDSSHAVWESLLDDTDQTLPSSPSSSFSSTSTEEQDWRNGVRKVMKYFHERTDGSWIEERRSSLTFHYAEAHDPEIAARQASDLADQIAGSRGARTNSDVAATATATATAVTASNHNNNNIRVVLEDGTVTVELLDITKATAAERVWRRWFCRDCGDCCPRRPLVPRPAAAAAAAGGGTFLFVAGGSRSDEALFRWANRLLVSSSASGGGGNRGKDAEGEEEEEEKRNGPINTASGTGTGTGTDGDGHGPGHTEEASASASASTLHVTTLTVGSHPTEAKTTLGDGMTISNVLGALHALEG